MANDPYKILGVGKNATDAEIKAAYRKLAKKYHPDLNPGNKEADAKFKDIGAANDLLNDKDKRAAFDQGLIDMEGQPKRPQGGDFYRDHAQGRQGARYYQAGGGDSFDMGGMGGMDDLFSFFRGGAAQQQAPQASRYSAEVEFMEAALGGSKRVTLPDGRTLDIAIPAGVADGQQLRLKGQGANGTDAFVELRIRPHATFSRKGQDVYAEVMVGFQESILGSKITVPTIHGEVEVTVPKGASSGANLRLKGKGIKAGDHYAKIKLVMPPVIDGELEAAVRQWAEAHPFNPRRQKEGAR